MTKEEKLAIARAKLAAMGGREALQPTPAPVAAPEPKYGLGETILEKAAKGASFGTLPALQTVAEMATPTRNPDEGFVDYLQRLAQAAASSPGKVALSTALKLFGGEGLKDVETSREQFLGRGERMQADRPKTSIASEVLGSLAMPVGPAPAKGLISMAKQGMAMGGAQALGSALSEGEGLPDVLARTGAGVAGGGLGGAAFGLASKGIEAVTRAPAAMKSFAEQRAIKALNPQLKDLKALAGGDVMDEKAIGDLGRTLLNRKMVRFGDKSSTVAKRLAAEEASSGAAIGRALDAADEAARVAGVLPVRPGRVATDLALEGAEFSPLESGLASEYFKQADKFSQLPRGVGIKEGERLKRILQGQLNYAVPTTEQSNVNAALGRSASGMRGEVERAIGEVGEMAKRPELLGEFMKAKSEYAPIATALDIAQAGSLRDFRNRWISPTDYGAGLGQFVRSGRQEGVNPAMGGLTGAALALAHKAARERGSASLAVGADKLGRGLGSVLEFAGPAIDAASEVMSRAGGRPGGALSEYLGIQGSDLETAKKDFTSGGSQP